MRLLGLYTKCLDLYDRTALSNTSLSLCFWYFPAVHLHAGLTTLNFCNSAKRHERQLWKLWHFFYYFYFYFIRSHDSSEPVPSTSSEPVDNRPPTQEGKQTSQESASTSERPRSHQAPVKICQIAMEAGSHSRGYRKWFWYPSGLHIILL